MKSLFRKRAERECKIWIKNCTESDAPRLASETYPADVKIDEDVNWSGDPLNLTLDYYRPFNVDSSKECFLLIHGGAFCYGTKVLDKCFGMHLARYSGIPVANMDYTLMPEAGLSKIVGQIFKCMNFLTANYGIQTFHLTGDSAGGYLAMISALAARNSHIAHDLWVFEKLKGKVVSTSPICGGFRYPPKGFPAIFFEEAQTEHPKVKQRLPDYVYDISKIAVLDKDLKVCLITGEDDFLREDNHKLKEILSDALFYDADNEGELHMHHVFPIAHPEWPQSVKAIQLITDNATRKA
ncbi:MAG: alpha/beta hydrolase [Clostridiales bacterium]|nr:alpha/beta hydrolase [Clostridiales bacterium]